ncbi:PP2C family protein-serine/threonine phosphatase [Arthrobacter sp. NPDC092385]|uniref:PP2C family protein-serine/threonine phosphatase n=1 Tax=Arthrobacter sp. NPDC092385 TaxID=3363943 RepID=UPI00382838B0
MNGPASGIAPGDEQKRLASLASTELLASPPEERFDRVTRLAQKLFGVSTATVALIADDRQVLKSLAGTLDTVIPRAAAFCSHTIASRDTLVVEDARQDDRFRSNPLVLGQPNIRFYAGQPLQGPGGWNIGTLCLIDQDPRAFTPEQEQILRDLAAIVQREISVSTDMLNAAKIQRAHRPAPLPGLPGYEVHAATRPAGDLSGDFYDWQFDGRFLRFTVADVMGKGAGPAILAATVQSRLRSTGPVEPGEALTAVSEALENDLALEDVFVTAFTATLDVRTGAVRYSDAGHSIAHHVTADGTVSKLPASGPPLGIIPDCHWETTTLVLEPGGSLIIPSDGILELANDDLHQLQSDLQAVTRAGADIEASIHALIDAPSHPSDDLTLLVVRRSLHQPPEQGPTAELPAPLPLWTTSPESDRL